MATTENKPFHHESQHDPDRCEAIIPGTEPIPVDRYQSNRCGEKKGHTSPHDADFRFWRDESNPQPTAEVIVSVRLTVEEADAICESWAGGKVDHRLLHGAIGKVEDALEAGPDPTRKEQQ